MLVWCEVDQERLTHNICVLRAHVGSDVLIAPVVKSNGYGHGILIAAHAFLAGGAHWLCVNSLEEAQVLRAGGVICPVYLLGPVDVENLEEVISLRLRLVIYTQELIQRLIELTPSTSGEQIRLHLKVETGNHRQGVSLSEALTLAQLIHQTPHLYLEGVCSHFANIEDTTDHSYAHLQMERFLLISQSISAITPHPLMRHISNSAATLLWPEHTMELVRVGIGAYGLWPSRETLSVAKYLQTPLIDLRPALCWKVKVVQLKEVPEGSNIGYGCTFTTNRPTLIAILPVGYYDGYDRGLSNLAHVLIRGRRAPVRGRVCMNMMMVEVTDIPDVSLGDEVVLLGTQGAEEVSAELLASWAGTINYEIIARIGTHIPRITHP